MAKKEILLENGTYNSNHNKVKDLRFLEDIFYDPQDLVQVKYEMLRSACNTGQTISEVATSFGFSRAAYYKIKNAFDKEGISALVPRLSGPKNPRKLTSGHQQFIDHYLLENPSVSSSHIADILKKERGLDISRRTIERYRKERRGQ